MIPWIADRTDGEYAYLLDGGTGWPHFNLIALLSYILQDPREKEQLVFVSAPRSVVFHGDEDATYLFWRKSRVPFVSFASGSNISSVGFRYNDPMDQSSGRRKSPTFLTGWQGVAELTDAAVRRSRTWKDLETIEVESRERYGEEHVVYEVWAKPSCDRLVSWGSGRNYNSGAYLFRRNKAVKLAHVQVTRQRIDGYLLEMVNYVTPYPELRGYDSRFNGFHTNSQWLEYAPTGIAEQPNCLPPIYVDLSEHNLMSIQPHDGLEFNISWM